MALSHNNFMSGNHFGKWVAEEFLFFFFFSPPVLPACFSLIRDSLVRSDVNFAALWVGLGPVSQNGQVTCISRSDASPLRIRVWLLSELLLSTVRSAGGENTGAERF